MGCPNCFQQRSDLHTGINLVASYHMKQCGYTVQSANCTAPKLLKFHIGDDEKVLTLFPKKPSKDILRVQEQIQSAIDTVDSGKNFSSVEQIVKSIVDSIVPNPPEKNACIRPDLVGTATAKHGPISIFDRQGGKCALVLLIKVTLVVTA